MKPLESFFPPPNLPILLPNETLYSWYGHIHLWNGNASVLQTSLQLTDIRYSALLHDFPASLDTMIEKTGGIFNNPTELALRHTLLGYFLTFRSSEFGQEILQKVRLGSYQHLKYKLGIPASRIGAEHPLKCCPKCLSEDLAEFGRGYWHLSHQFPSAFVCSKHALPIHILRLAQSPVHQRIWLLPESAPFMEKIGPLNGTQTAKLLALAQISIEASQMKPGSLDERLLAWAYQSRIHEEGLLTTRGSLKIKMLNQWVCDYYAGLEHLPGFQVLHSLQKETGGFVGTIARKQPKRGHPFKHLLLINLLFDSWNAFLEHYAQVRDAPPDWLQPPSHAEVPQDDPRVSRFINLIRDQGMSLTRAGILTGISTTTATQWAKRHNIKYTARTKTLDDALLNTVRAKLRKGTPKKT